MKLATFDGPDGRHVGIVEGVEIVDLTAADPSLAAMTDLLERGPRDTVRVEIDKIGALENPVIAEPGPGD